DVLVLGPARPFFVIRVLSMEIITIYGGDWKGWGFYQHRPKHFILGDKVLPTAKLVDWTADVTGVSTIEEFISEFGGPNKFGGPASLEDAKSHRGTNKLVAMKFEDGRVLLDTMNERAFKDHQSTHPLWTAPRPPEEPEERIG